MYNNINSNCTDYGQFFAIDARFVRTPTYLVIIQ